MDNTEKIQTVSPESEDQSSPTGFIKLLKTETSSKIKTKRKDIQCYNCTRKGHVMKDCPQSLKIVKRKKIHFHTCEKFEFHKERLSKMNLVLSIMYCSTLRKKVNCHNNC